MAQMEGESAKAKKSKAVHECTCAPRSVNHFTVLYQPCLRHPDVIESRNRIAKEPGYAEYSAEVDARNGRALYYRQQMQEKADRVLAELRAKAAAGGPPVTLTTIGRAMGFGAPEQYGKLPGKAVAGAWKDLRGEAQADRAHREPPPGFDPNAFHLQREMSRLHRQIEALPDDSEHAHEYSRLNEILFWCRNNLEAGRSEFDATVNRFQPQAKADPWDGLVPDDDEVTA